MFAVWGSDQVCNVLHVFENIHSAASFMFLPLSSICCFILHPPHPPVLWTVTGWWHHAALYTNHIKSINPSINALQPRKCCEVISRKWLLIKQTCLSRWATTLIHFLFQAAVTMATEQDEMAMISIFQSQNKSPINIRGSRNVTQHDPLAPLCHTGCCLKLEKLLFPLIPSIA